jgi:serine/threonine protein phosphatase PrpC
VDDASGSTASVLIANGSEIVVGAVGDSRCVLSRNGKAIELSSDHRLSTRPDERKRIEVHFAGNQRTFDYDLQTNALDVFA